MLGTEPRKRLSVVTRQEAKGCDAAAALNHSSIEVTRRAYVDSLIARPRPSSPAIPWLPVLAAFALGLMTAFDVVLLVVALWDAIGGSEVGHA